jgi:hypothetical protein
MPCSTQGHFSCRRVGETKINMAASCGQSIGMGSPSARSSLTKVSPDRGSVRDEAGAIDPAERQIINAMNRSGKIDS